MINNLYQNKLIFRQFLILVRISSLEHFCHGLGHVHVASVHPDLDEEGHHVEKFCYADVTIAILIK